MATFHGSLGSTVPGGNLNTSSGSNLGIRKYKYSHQSLEGRYGYSSFMVFLFMLMATYLALPLVDLPLLGFSLSAPIFALIAMQVLFRPPEPWFKQYKSWILLAGLIWLAVFISAVGNGLLSGGVAINSEGVLTVIRYAYWLLVFVVTTYFASQGEIIRKITKLLGWSILTLVILRWGEVLVFRNIGAWTGTHLLSENDYGFLFSTLSPFLLIFLLQERGIMLFLAIVANIFLWGAAAINGSRGSWVSIAVGLAIGLMLLVSTNPKKFLSLLIGVLLTAGSLVIWLFGSHQLSTAIMDRFDTMQNLETDKSYMIRQLMNQKALLLFEESPLIGVGAARFRLSSVPLEIPAVLSYAPQEHFDRKSAHNSYLSFLAENGLLGFVLYVLFLIRLALRGFKVQDHFTRQGEYWALAVFLSFIQMSIHMWVISSLTNTLNWFIYGLVGAMIMTYRSQ
jgi:O-antigen ligase